MARLRNIAINTGGGDAPGLNAVICGVVSAALNRGWEPLEACRFATATAAQVAQGLATLGKLESFEATQAAMNAARTAESA